MAEFTPLFPLSARVDLQDDTVKNAPSRSRGNPHPNLTEGRFGMDLDVTILIQTGIFLLVLFWFEPNSHQADSAHY